MRDDALGQATYYFQHIISNILLFFYLATFVPEKVNYIVYYQSGKKRFKINGKTKKKIWPTHNIYRLLDECNTTKDICAEAQTKAAAMARRCWQKYIHTHVD